MSDKFKGDNDVLPGTRLGELFRGAQPQFTDEKDFPRVIQATTWIQYAFWDFCSPQIVSFFSLFSFQAYLYRVTIHSLVHNCRQFNETRAIALETVGTHPTRPRKFRKAAAKVVGG